MSTQRGMIRKRKTTSGELRYDARYRPAPKAKQISKSFNRKTDAEQWLKNRLTELDAGTHVEAQRSSKTFSEYAAEWVESREHAVSASTKAQDSAMLKHLDKIADLPVKAITRRDVQAIINEKAREYAPSTVRQIKLRISGVLDFALKDRALNRNVANDIELPSQQKQRASIVLTPKQLSELVETAQQHLFDEYALLIETIAETGLRFSEALGLTTAALDADAATLRVFRQLDKRTLTLDKKLKTNRSERTVPISDELAQKLLDHLTAKGARFDQDALMFTTPNGAAIRQSNFNRRYWKPLVEALGHDEMSVHDLRRTFATQSADAGVPVHTLAAILGHSQATAQSYYIHAADETNRAGIERLRAYRAN